jgi:hypothetical protein
VLLADAAGHLALDGCGATVAYRPRRPGGCRLWRFEHLSDGYYRVVNAATGRALGGRGPAARWRIEASPAGGYRLTDTNGYAFATRIDAP